MCIRDSSKDKQYTMEVYTTDGKLKFKENFNIPYTTIKLSGGNILMYNSSQMLSLIHISDSETHYGVCQNQKK